MDNLATVTVQLQLPEGYQLPAGARAHVTIEDATAADASSVVVGATMLNDIDPDVSLIADVDVPEVDPQALLIARAHVISRATDRADIRQGDLVSTQSHPVLTRGNSNFVVVPLSPVGG